MNSFFLFKLQVITTIVFFFIAFLIFLNRPVGKKDVVYNSLSYLAIFSVFHGLAISTEHFLNFYYTLDNIRSEVSVYLATLHSLSLISLVLCVISVWTQNLLAHRFHQIILALFFMLILFVSYLGDINSQHIIIHLFMVFYSVSVWAKTERSEKATWQTGYERYAFPLALMICAVSLLISPHSLSEKLFLLGASGFLLLVVYQKLRMYSEASRQIASETLKGQLHDAHLKELGEWSAALAHEMKTPLSSALLSSDMIVRLAKKDDRILDHAIRMKESIQRVIGTCQSVLNYSQTLTPDKSEFLIDDAIEEAISLLNFRLKHFSISRKIQPGLTVFGDKTLLLSVWSNLLSNAIDASEEADVKTIAIEAFSHQGAIHIKIMDEGEGISADNMALIEDAFFTTKHGNHGTGVGLTVVSNILKSHRGSLHFDDKATGACAHVVIPENIQ